MNGITARAVKWVVIVTAAAGIAVLASSGAHAIVVDVYLLCLGAVVLLALVRTTRTHATAQRSSFDAAYASMRRAPAEPAEPALVRELELSSYNAFHFHSRLRPLLRDVAAHRLRSRYGVELDLEPARARELVAREAWEAVRPDRPPPQDRMGAGPTMDDLSVMLDELEAI
ncbi:MAG: hypothetical protein ACJ74M_10975 [Gaiellaceae bacterium]|jgi:hypothetical protein